MTITYKLGFRLNVEGVDEEDEDEDEEDEEFLDRDRILFFPADFCRELVELCREFGELLSGVILFLPLLALLKTGDGMFSSFWCNSFSETSLQKLNAEIYKFV